MSNIELVVRIPEKDYIYIAKKHCLPSCDNKTLRKFCYEMISNSIPLPKNHGKLKDTDVIIKNAEKWGKDNPNEYIRQRNADIIAILQDEPTLVEANNVENEE